MEGAKNDTRTGTKIVFTHQYLLSKHLCGAGNVGHL